MSGQEITIVRMAAEHLDAIAALEQQCFSEPWSRPALEEELTNPQAYFVVAVLAGNAAGYAGMHVALDEAYTDNVAVAPEFRRHGIGRALMAALAQQCQASGCRFLSLEVRQSNEAAISLYREMGFREEGRRKRFYRSPEEDALIFTLFFENAG